MSANPNAINRIIGVTPAGRRRYLEILQYYVLRDEAIHEWHLWDNCRTEADRSYLQALAKTHPKIKIVQLDGVDGTFRSINRFHRFCNDPSAFYIRMDDDLVYLPEGFAARFHARAVAERGQFIWWSPLVVNNAICSWLLKYHSTLNIPDNVSCQAMDRIGWDDPEFAQRMHEHFLAALSTGQAQAFCVPDFPISLSRYSVNCLGLFGSDIIELGDDFCPLNVDEEEWISAVLPSKLGKPGKILGDITVAHFSFFTQEAELLRSGVLDRYYHLAGLTPLPYSRKKAPLRRRLIRRARKMRNWISA